MQREYRFSERGILLKELDNTVGQLKQKETQNENENQAGTESLGYHGKFASKINIQVIILFSSSCVERYWTTGVVLFWLIATRRCYSTEIKLSSEVDTTDMILSEVSSKLNGTT